MGHQRVYPFDRHRNCASAEGMVGHEIVAKPRQNASCWQCRERRLGQVGFAHHTFRPCPPSHHTVCDVMKPCFGAVKQNHSDATIFLKGLSTSSRQCLTSAMCLMLSKISPDERHVVSYKDFCSSSSQYVLSTCPLCMQMTKQAEYIPAPNSQNIHAASCSC